MQFKIKRKNSLSNNVGLTGHLFWTLAGIVSSYNKHQDITGDIPEGLAVGVFMVAGKFCNNLFKVH